MFNFEKPKALLESCPVYKATPMQEAFVNKQKLIIKDESERMGLGSFKALGGFYAVAQLIAMQTRQTFAPNEYLSPTMKATAKYMVFVCASAGNHGISVAVGAKIFGARCRIHLAKNVPEEFAIRLRAQGAEVIRSGKTYEDSVSIAMVDAKNLNAIHLADSSWPGYTEIPRLVMEGYTVIAEEMRQEFEAKNTWPTHVYLQAGVGGLAAAMCFMIRHNWAVQPKITVVEPEQAPCLSESVKHGKICTVNGKVSNMGRLDCKTPSLLAFEILNNMADSFVTVSDQAALNAVSIAKDINIDTTPSGAAGLAALLNELSTIDANSLPLVIITEGDISANK